MIASRSPIVRLGVRTASPLAIAVACYLFFAGHNRPGGGFAAGLVLGAVVALRALAGLARPRGNGLIAAGVLTMAGVAIAPLLAGRRLLDQVVVEADLPLLGSVKSGTALLFDAGVAMVVVGLVIAVLEGFAGEALQPAVDGESP